MSNGNLSHSREAVVLHTVEDAKDYIKKHEDGRLLLSTNPSVDTYIKYETNLTSTCLSHYLSYEQIKSDIEYSITRTDEIIKGLDEFYSNYLSDIEVLKGIKAFYTLYSFTSKFAYAPYWTILQAIRNAIAEHKISEIFVYDIKGFSVFGCQTSFAHLMQYLDCDARIHVLGESRVKNTSIIRMIMRAPRRGFRVLLNRLKRPRLRGLDETKPTILVYESLYDLAFVMDRLKDVNIIHYKKDALLPSNQPAGVNTSPVKSNVGHLPVTSHHTLDGLIENELIDDFNKNIDSYIESIQYLEQISKKYPIQFGLSGNAATFGLKSLVYAYLRKRKIPVAIGQHGFNYGIQDPYGMHIYSDYNRCDYFFSYGFCSDHLKKLYQAREGEIECEVIPLGSTRLRPVKTAARKRIDILYPLMNTVSMLQQGLFLGKPDEQAEIQEKLLLYLDSKKGFNIIVKPFINYNEYNCSVVPVLRRLKNVKIVDNIHFIESFSKFDVRSVLIDYISTAASEAMPYDVEIFAVGNPMDGIEQGAVDLLKKRVYYSECVDEIISLIDRKLDDNLEPKRDSIFMDKYLFRENTENNVQDFVMRNRNKICAV